MITIVCITLLIIASVILMTLSIIDLKTWLLPDPLNLALAITGVTFHFATGFEIIPPYDMIFGALIGSGLLYIIRMGGNAYYKQESLGLGDVKLLGAAGLWLGLEGTVIAIILGAAAGVVHGLILAGVIAHKEKTRYSLQRLMLPAGPGFCVGIFLSGLWLFADYIKAHL